MTYIELFLNNSIACWTAWISVCIIALAFGSWVVRGGFTAALAYSVIIGVPTGAALLVASTIAMAIAMAIYQSNKKTAKAEEKLDNIQRILGKNLKTEDAMSKLKETMNTTA